MRRPDSATTWDAIILLAGSIMIFILFLTGVKKCAGQCREDFNGDGLVNTPDLLLSLSTFGTECPSLEEIVPYAFCQANDPCFLAFDNATVIRVGSTWEELDQYTMASLYSAIWILNGDTISYNWDLGSLVDLPDSSYCEGTFSLTLAIRNNQTKANWAHTMVCYIIDACTNPPPCPEYVSFSVAFNISQSQTPGFPQFETAWYPRKYFTGYR